MMTSVMRRLLLLLLPAGLSACGSLAPTDRPDMKIPAHYAASPVSRDLPVADGVGQHLSDGAASVPAWWRAYRNEALNALVTEGLAHNPSLEATRHSLLAAHDELRAQLGDTELPAVNVAFSPLRQRTLSMPGLPQETLQDTIYTADVSASYSFNLAGATSLVNQGLAAKIAAQKWQLEASQRALAANIVVTAINIASLQAQLDETAQLADLGAQQARLAALRYRLGSASQSDMLTARQQAAELAAALPPLRANVLALRHAEAVLLGRNPEDAPPPLALDSLSLPTDLPTALPSELLHRRPDILAAEAAVNAAAAQAGAARAALFPTLSLTASYGRGGFDWSTLTSPAGLIWSAGASLTMPLFQGGALLARKDEYRALYDAAVQQYRQTVLDAFRSVADSLADLEEDANRLEQATLAGEAAGQRRQNMMARYQLGAVAFDDTLQAAQNDRNARIRYLQARTARLADTAALFDAMGELPGETLGKPDF